jgi:hypothetical protein
MSKAELIKNMVDGGRTADLFLMLEGESPYTSDASEGAPRDSKLAKLWTAALYHLRFVAEFGNRSDSVMKDGKWLSAFPEEFSEWLEAGAPGITLDELEKYLRDNPLLN